MKIGMADDVEGVKSRGKPKKSFSGVGEKNIGISVLYNCAKIGTSE